MHMYVGYLVGKELVWNLVPYKSVNRTIFLSEKIGTNYNVSPQMTMTKKMMMVAFSIN